MKEYNGGFFATEYILLNHIFYVLHHCILFSHCYKDVICSPYWTMDFVCDLRLMQRQYIGSMPFYC